MNVPPDRPRTVLLRRTGFVGSVAVGAALLGSAFGGMVGVDRKLEAATPERGTTRFVDDSQRGSGPGHDCPGRHQSREF